MLVTGTFMVCKSFQVPPKHLIKKLRNLTIYLETLTGKIFDLIVGKIKLVRKQFSSSKVWIF